MMTCFFLAEIIWNQISFKSLGDWAVFFQMFRAVRANSCSTNLWNKLQAFRFMNVFCHVVAVKIVCKKRVSMCLPLGNRIPRSYQTSLTKPWFLAGGAAFNSAWWLSRQKLIQKLAPEPSFSMILNNLRIYHDNSWFIHVNWDHYTSIYPIIKYYKCPLYMSNIFQYSCHDGIWPFPHSPQMELSDPVATRHPPLEVPAAPEFRWRWPRVPKSEFSDATVDIRWMISWWRNLRWMITLWYW